MSRIIASLAGIGLAGALIAGCSELPCDIEVEGGRSELRIGQELRAQVVWEGKRVDQVKRFRGARFVWRSSRDGRLGEGVELRTSSLSQGPAPQSTLVQVELHRGPVRAPRCFEARSCMEEVT